MIEGIDETQKSPAQRLRTSLTEIFEVVSY
jgi:hypothetical protein